jgi:MFS family permease
MAMLCMFTSLVLIPSFAATTLPAGTQLLLIGLGGFLMTCTVGPVSAIVIDVTHPGLRATGASVLSLFQNLLGLAAGPVIAGALSDAIGLQAALALIPIFGGLAALCFLIASRSYEADLDRVGTTADWRLHAWPDDAPTAADPFSPDSRGAQ